MSFDIISQKAPYCPKSFEDFIFQFKPFNKQLIIDVARSFLWKNFNGSLEPEYDDNDIHLLQSYAAYIVILALANFHENCSFLVGGYCLSLPFCWKSHNDIIRPDVYSYKGILHDFCSMYVNIGDLTNDKEFLKAEAEKIFKKLEETSLAQNIPKDKLSIDAIVDALKYVFLHRILAKQHTDHLVWNDFYTDLSILKELDKGSKGKISSIMKDKFNANIDIVQVMRAATFILCIASLERKDGIFNNGIVDIDSTNFNPDIVKEYNVDPELCKALLEAFSYNQKDLKSKWIEEVLGQPEYYQPYYPDPLSQKIAIQLNTGNLDRQLFMIPSPTIFIHGFRAAMFSLIFEKTQGKKEKGKMGAQIGKCIEEHIHTALSCIFHKYKVKRLNKDPENNDQQSKHADFWIELSSVNLIIEVKKDIGAIVNKAVMNPEHIAKMWNILYGACVQCSASIQKDILKNKKINIAIVIIGNKTIAEYLPFGKFAHISEIYKDLKLGYVEYFSWHKLEHILSLISVDKFEEELLRRRENIEMNTEEYLTFEPEKGEPAHKYEYLEKEKQEIFINLSA